MEKYAGNFRLQKYLKSFEVKMCSFPILKLFGENDYFLYDKSGQLLQAGGIAQLEQIFK